VIIKYLDKRGGAVF